VRLDHLVYAAPDLEEAVARVEALLGVEAVPGGSHPGAGTRNALVSFGGETYLEIIAPDPTQPDPAESRWFGIDGLKTPCLATWCARSDGLETLAGRAEAAGIDLGPVREGGRRRPDGLELRWRVTDPRAHRCSGLLPFFIDWLGSPHPGRGVGQGCSVLGLRGRHPEPDRVSSHLATLDVRLPVEAAAEPGLVARIETPNGVVELS